MVPPYIDSEYRRLMALQARRFWRLALFLGLFHHQNPLAIICFLHQQRDLVELHIMIVGLLKSSSISKSDAQPGTLEGLWR